MKIARNRLASGFFFLILLSVLLPAMPVGAAQAVTDLKRYLATDAIPYRQFVILGGVSPIGELHLGGGVAGSEGGLVGLVRHDYVKMGKI